MNSKEMWNKPVESCRGREPQNESSELHHMLKLCFLKGKPNVQTQCFEYSIIIKNIISFK